MGRPLSLRIGGSRAALGSRPPGGLAGEPGARMAVGVGVVVSAFRFTPFFCEEKQDRSLYLRSTSIKLSLPIVQKKSTDLYLGKGLGWGTCRDSKERGSSGVQGLEKGRGDDRWVGNVEDSGRYLRRWSIQGCVGYRRDSRHLMGTGDTALEC